MTLVSPQTGQDTQKLPLEHTLRFEKLDEAEERCAAWKNQRSSCSRDIRTITTLPMELLKELYDNAESRASECSDYLLYVLYFSFVFWRFGSFAMCVAWKSYRTTCKMIIGGK